MAKTLIFGALLMMAATTAPAAPHYLEVWNPPEAHSSASPRVARAHKTVRKHATRAKPTAERRTQRGVMKSIAAPLPAVAAPERRVPTFDDIPRQRTPQGNVLRVNSGSTTAEVER